MSPTPEEELVVARAELRHRARARASGQALLYPRPESELGKAVRLRHEARLAAEAAKNPMR